MRERSKGGYGAGEVERRKTLLQADGPEPDLHIGATVLPDPMRIGVAVRPRIYATGDLTDLHETGPIGELGVN